MNNTLEVDGNPLVRNSQPFHFQHILSWQARSFEHLRIFSEPVVGYPFRSIEDWASGVDGLLVHHAILVQVEPEEG